MEEMMEIEVIATQQRWPNIFKTGVTHVIHVIGPRGAHYGFNRNAKGETWDWMPGQRAPNCVLDAVRSIPDWHFDVAPTVGTNGLGALQ
jgi:hypothetical protein